MKVLIRLSALLSAFLILSSGMCSPDNPEPTPQPNPGTPTPSVVSVSSVSLNKTTLTLTEGESEVLNATVKPDNATDKTVAWSSSDASVAKVENGKVTAVKAGTATISAKAGDKSATCTVTVNKKVVAVTSVTLNKTELTLTEGEAETLTATVKPDDATDKTVTWTTSDASIATVDANGKVTAVKAGTATITAKAGDQSATCMVTVKQKGFDGGDPEGFISENGEW